MEFIHTGVCNNIQHCTTTLSYTIYTESVEFICPEIFKTFCQLHPSGWCVTFCYIFPLIVTLWIIYLQLRHFHKYSPTISLHLQQTEPTPRLVRNPNPYKNQTAQCQSALVFKKAANLHFPSTDRIPIMCLVASCFGWLIAWIWLMQHDADTNQHMGDDERQGECQGTWEDISSCEDDDLDHPGNLLHLCLACWELLKWSTKVW
jgi:hypothetical protein